MEKMSRKNKILPILGKYRGLYSCIHYSSIPNAVNKNSISVLTCVEVLLTLLVIRFHWHLYYIVSVTWKLYYYFFKSPVSVHHSLGMTYFLSWYISPRGYNTLCPSYELMHTTPSKHSATFINQFATFFVITAIKNILYLLLYQWLNSANVELLLDDFIGEM